MRIMDAYLMLGLLVHIGFLGLTDWLGYRHIIKHGYDHTVLILAVLNVAIGLGIYYLVFRPLRQRALRRKAAQAEGKLRVKP
jgi:hypothetical protein